MYQRSQLQQPFQKILQLIYCLIKAIRNYEPNGGVTTEPNGGVTWDPNGGVTSEPNGGVTIEPNGGVVCKPVCLTSLRKLTHATTKSAADKLKKLFIILPLISDVL